jgi:hypothetical protein
MYTSFTARDYRCFRQLTVKPLRQINLIAGRNNVGKTALLEAIWIHYGYHNPELAIRVDNFRGLTVFRKDEFLWDLFRDFDPEKPIELEGTDANGQLHSLRIRSSKLTTSFIPLNAEDLENGNGHRLPLLDVADQETNGAIGAEISFEYEDGAGNQYESSARLEEGQFEFTRPSEVRKPIGIYLAARRPLEPTGTAQRLSKLALAKKDKEIVRVMRIIEPRLEGLSVQATGGTMIYGDVEGMDRLIPVALIGDGLGRTLEIAVAIPEAQNGILLVDEIENGLHYSVIARIWEALAQLAKEYNVQIIATTHSLECIRAAYEVFRESVEDNFRLHRLDRTEKDIEVVTYSPDTLGTAIEMDLEIR